MKILITGITSGIGEGLAKAYLEQGHQVYGLSRRPLKWEHDNLKYKQIDLAQVSAVHDGLIEMFEDQAEIDLVILNAGILGELKRLKDTMTEEIQKVMAINLWAQKNLIDALLDRVRLNQVIAISSGAGVNGNAGWGGYALSKAALNMLIKLYSAEIPNVHWNTFAPGLVDTAMQNVICDEVSAEEFPSVARIQESRGTLAMPSPSEVAPKLILAFEILKNGKNGEFFDLRKMGI